MEVDFAGTRHKVIDAGMFTFSRDSVGPHWGCFFGLKVGGLLMLLTCTVWSPIEFSFV